MNCPIRPVTHGPLHHFFGYYDKCPWDATGRYLLALETTFMERRPTADDAVTVGMVALAEGNRFIPLAQTHAWNWQQGCMLRWLPSGEIIFNDLQDGQFVAVVLNPQSGARRVLPRPVYAVRPDGQAAVTLNFSRLYDARPGYGYAGVPDPWRGVSLPTDDGVYEVDLATGASRLLFSLAAVAALPGTTPTLYQPGDLHRFNHLQYNTDGSRFCFLHRWGVPGERGVSWTTRLFTANADGSELYCLSDEHMVSHFDWQDPVHLLAWARRDGQDRFFLMRDRTQQAQAIGEGAMTVDGHCSFSPAGRWLMNDTYPDAQGDRTLYLWDLQANRRVDIGRFHGPTPPDVEIRCDLHPRWSRDGRQVCIDSIHEGTRQVYVIDVSNVTGS